MRYKSIAKWNTPVSHAKTDNLPEPMDQIESANDNFSPTTDQITISAVSSSWRVSE